MLTILSQIIVKENFIRLVPDIFDVVVKHASRADYIAHVEGVYWICQQ